MSEKEQLTQARQFASLGKKEEARKILLKLYDSTNLDIKLNTILILLAVIDHVRENDQLIKLAYEGIKISQKIGKSDVQLYLLTRKNHFLVSKMTFLTHRKKNLMLSATVFDWIDFSLEKDKKEYEYISVQREQLKKETDVLETDIMKIMGNEKDHYLRGNIFMSLGESYGTKFLDTQIDLMVGGKIKTKLANMHSIKKWGLYKYLIFDRNSRKKINECAKKCISFFEKSIKEFKTGDKKSDLAHAYYNLSIQYNTMYKFAKARKYLNLAAELAKATSEEYLLSQIIAFRKQVNDQNRHIRNYVEELGLD